MSVVDPTLEEPSRSMHLDELTNTDIAPVGDVSPPPAGAFPGTRGAARAVGLALLAYEVVRPIAACWARLVKACTNQHDTVPFSSRLS